MHFFDNYLIYHSLRNNNIIFC